VYGSDLFFFSFFFTVMNFDNFTCTPSASEDREAYYLGSQANRYYHIFILIWTFLSVKQFLKHQDDRLILRKKNFNSEMEPFIEAPKKIDFESSHK